MSKLLSSAKYYSDFDPISEIAAATDLLGESRGKFTPTDVLRMLGYTECKEMRSLVVIVAEMNGYRVGKSGKGFAIFDKINEVENE